MTALLLSLCLLVSVSSLSASPSWTRDIQIDSGQFKAVNFQLYLAGNTSGIVASNKTVTGALHFNNTKLNSTPRVILALKSYGVIPSSAITSLTIGYKITITSKNATNLTYSLTTYGAAIVALHYQYLAVVGYNNVFCLQFYSVPLNSSSNVWNNALGGSRVDSFTFSNPQSCTCGSNFTSTEMVMQAWPYYYTYVPTSSSLSVLTSAKAASSSTFTLTVTVDNGTSLQDLGVSVLYLNTTLVYEYSYTLFIDITTYNITGSNTSTATTSTTMDNTTLQYQFRNSEEGVQGLYLPFSAVGSPTVFYFTSTSASTSQLYYISIQSRARVCANSTPVYYVDDKLCHDACPAFNYALNVTYSYCKRCHYSCLQCSSADISTACTACNGTLIRTLSNTSCLCNLTYFDNGTELCVACDYTCRTCLGTAANACLSCDSSGLHRTLANSTCGCSYGYYENVTCFACLNSCIECGFTIANSSYTCKACNSTLHMQVDPSQQTCICSDGYYNNSGTCSPCIAGCLICIDGSSCTTCNSSAHWQKNNTDNTCKCSDSFYLTTVNSTSTCTACNANCLTCSGLSTNCLTCDSSLHRTLINTTCQCSSSYYENTTCIACLNNCQTCNFYQNNQTFQCLSCNSSLHFTFDTNHTSCICQNGYYNAGNVCTKCGDGCLLCSVATSCDSCDTGNNFQTNVTDNSCKCADHFYKKIVNSTASCDACHYTCLTCTDSQNSSCLTCDSSLLRNLSSTTCTCSHGYYDNTTCISCSGNCLTCSMLNLTYQCLTCDSSLHQKVDSTSKFCECMNGYYNNSGTCTPCVVGCLVCSVGTSCGTCDTANHWQANTTDNTCKCADRFYKKTVNSSFTCDACHYTCLTCTDSQSNSCLSCDASLFRNLSTSSCVCPQGYYDNTTCINCNGNCLTCSMLNLTYQCLTCDSSLHHQVDPTNKFCECSNGYYNNSGTCTLCMTGCLLCSSASICSSCDSINHFTLSNNTCICQNGFILNGSLCSVVFATNATCGNGILQTGQQCDDANTFNLDGCSSTCQIQADHFCLNNITNVSVCYYNQPLLFTTQEIFKQPLENRVIIRLLVSAPNCNTTFLKTYLQSGFSVTLLSKSRLLASSDITSQSVQYDQTTSTATVDFQYNQDIDLNKKEIKFVSSQSTAQSQGKYFYDSPSTVVTLSSPTNLLLTTYASDQQIQGFKAISNAFAALIALMWLFWLISVCYNQAATAVEYMIVIQIAYEALLQRKYITDGWIGLVLYGKYCYGYNISYSKDASYDRLRILSLDTYLFHTLNITTAVLVLIVVIVLAIFCYETFKVQQQPNNLELNSTEAKIDMKVPPKTEEVAEQEQKQYKIKKGIALTLFQVGTSLSLLTIKIVVINLMLISVKVIVDVVIVVSLMAVCYTLMWYFYYRCFEFDFLNDFSFKRLLRDCKDTKKHRSKSSKFGNFFVKYFYLTIFLLLAGFGILDGAPSFGAPFYITIIIISILILVLMFVYKVYFRKMHLVRSACNVFALIGVMVLHLLESFQVQNPSQSKTGPIICLGLLYLGFALNFGMMGYIQYRRHRSRKVKYSSNKIAPADDIVIQYTEQHLPKEAIKIPAEFVEIAAEEQNNEIRRSNHSNVSLAQESKFESLKSRSKEPSVASTHKKKGMARHEHEQSYTKEKKEVQRQDVDSILRNIPDFAVVRQRLQAIQPGGNYQQQSQVQRIQVVQIDKSFSDFAKTKTKLKKDNIFGQPDQTTNKKHDQFAQESQS